MEAIILNSNDTTNQALKSMASKNLDSLNVETYSSVTDFILEMDKIQKPVDRVIIFANILTKEASEVAALPNYLIEKYKYIEVVCVANNESTANDFASTFFGDTELVLNLNGGKATKEFITQIMYKSLTELSKKYNNFVYTLGMESSKPQAKAPVQVTPQQVAVQQNTAQQNTAQQTATQTSGKKEVKKSGGLFGGLFAKKEKPMDKDKQAKLKAAKAEKEKLKRQAKSGKPVQTEAPESVEETEGTTVLEPEQPQEEVWGVPNGAYAERQRAEQLQQAKKQAEQLQQSQEEQWGVPNGEATVDDFYTTPDSVSDVAVESISTPESFGVEDTETEVNFGTFESVEKTSAQEEQWGVPNGEVVEETSAQEEQWGVPNGEAVEETSVQEEQWGMPNGEAVEETPVVENIINLDEDYSEFNDESFNEVETLTSEGIEETLQGFEDSNSVAELDDSLAVKEGREEVMQDNKNNEIPSILTPDIADIGFEDVSTPVSMTPKVNLRQKPSEATAPVRNPKPKMQRSSLVEDLTVDENSTSAPAILNVDDLGMMQEYAESTPVQVVEKVKIVEKVVEKPVGKGGGNTLYTNALAGKSVLNIVITGERRSGVTETALTLCDAMHKDNMRVLYVDFDTKRHGSIFYLDMGYYFESPPQQQKGLNLCQTWRDIEGKIWHPVKVPFACLVSDFTVYDCIEDAQKRKIAGSVLSTQRNFDAVVVDCPCDQLEYLNDFLYDSRLFVCVEPNMAACYNTFQFLDTVKLDARLKDRLCNSGSYILKVKDTKQKVTASKEFKECMKTFHDLFDLESIDSEENPGQDWTRMPLAAGVQSEVIKYVKQML